MALFIGTQRVLDGFYGKMNLVFRPFFPWCCYCCFLCSFFAVFAPFSIQNCVFRFANLYENTNTHREWEGESREERAGQRKRWRERKSERNGDKRASRCVTLKENRYHMFQYITSNVQCLLTAALSLEPGKCCHFLYLALAHVSFFCARSLFLR